MANEYARDVIAGRVLANKWVRLACQRHLNDLEASKSKAYRFKFDSHRASLPCEFMECMPFTEGDAAVARGRRTNKVKLEPWQIFIVCCIFGWVKKSNGVRRFREAYVCIPRKNGKSLLASLIALYMLILDGEKAPQVYSGATTQRQAMEVFKPAYRILRDTPEGVELRVEFGLEAHTQRIVCRFNGGTFAVLVRRPGDGAGASCVIIDEFHEHPTDVLRSTMKKGQRARLQPLCFIITTAGSFIEGPCHQFQQFGERMLAGEFENDALFCIVFTMDNEPYTDLVEGADALEDLALDCTCTELPNVQPWNHKQPAAAQIRKSYEAHEPACKSREHTLQGDKLSVFRPKGDDWKRERSHRKANPNWGISLNIETILQERDDAIHAAYLQNDHRTKTLNEWMNTGTAWMNMAAWDACLDKRLHDADFLEELYKLPCDEGEDLSAKIDLTSRCKIFKRGIDGKTHYFVKARHYVPEALANDGEHPHYAKWIASHHLTPIPGIEIDLGFIQQEIEDDIELFNYASLAFDPWSAMQMQQALAKQVKEDVVCSIPQQVKHLSDPMKEIQAAVLAGRLHHDGDPVLRFGVSCVVAAPDHKGNIFPRKNKSGWNKIDPFSAMLTGFNRAYIPGESVQTSVYETRGLIVL